MKLQNKITIVVPCKNEQDYIPHLLMHLRQQDIGNTRIIIADCSTDNTREVIQVMKGDLNVEIIEGGNVSFAKNSGAKLATTPYILFIDSDVRFFSDTVISDCVNEIEKNNLDLIGLYVKCYDGVICGHIHHAEIKEIEGIVYMNDGDWVESCTALVEHHNGKWEIVTWTKEKDDVDTDIDGDSHEQPK